MKNSKGGLKIQEEQGPVISTPISLKKILYDVQVSGLFAQVSCKQVYGNESEVSMEAVYVFPMPEEASIVGCEMIIGEKSITAELKEQAEAREEYDEAVESGHHAALLEQKRPNIFSMNVGGIEPGEKIEVKTVYIQRVPWQNNGGRFNLPMVVAPRFIPGNPIGKKGGGWAEDTDEVSDASLITPVVTKEGVSYTADIKVAIEPGFTCKIISPSHELIVGEHICDKESVLIEAKDLTPDRDFILCYQNGSSELITAAYANNFVVEKFATIILAPPGSVGVKIKSKDIVFCLDTSGSMDGAKIAGLKLVAEKVARKLAEESPNNRVAVVAFEYEIELVHDLSGVSESTYEAINGLESHGGTMAGKALDYCFGLLAKESEREKYILFVSDGETEDSWSRVERGVRVISVGIDSATNMSYIRDIARETGGTSLAIYPGEDYDAIANNLVGLLSGPVLRDVKIIKSGVENPEDALVVNDIYEGMPGIIHLKGAVLPDKIQVIGIDGSGQRITVNINLNDGGYCRFCHQLWAREKLRDPKLKDKEIIGISLRYGVLSSKTAFVAVSLKETPGQKPQRVEIPVSLPARWNYDKVFGADTAFSMLGRGGVKGIRMRRDIGMVPLEATGPAYRGVDIQNLGRRKSESKTPAFIASDDDDIVKKLETFLDDLQKGRLTATTAKQRWQDILRELTEDVIKGWSAVDKAKAFYLLLGLKDFVRVGIDIFIALKDEPGILDAEAHDWWSKAQRLMGKKV